MKYPKKKKYSIEDGFLHLGPSKTTLKFPSSCNFKP
jgi:hypothetical protein